jgi:cell division septation protein DedD
MEESVSWKGHSFTLLVFAGIVVLCSIFFVLGMLVGRTQGQRSAEAAFEAHAAKQAAAAEERKRDEILADPEPLPKVDAVPTPPPQAEPVKPPAKPAAAPPPPPRPAPTPPPAPGNSINLQIDAFRVSNAADKLAKEVQAKGFPAFILAPAAGDPAPMYRVQVGPYGNQAEVDRVKRKLESFGYKPIVKK